MSPVCFLDSSAVTKLVVAEPESSLLGSRLAGCQLVGSGLLVPEVTRAVRQVHGRRRDALLAQVLALIDLVAVDAALLAQAADVTAASLRTLDAVHLASALRLADRLDAFIAYDDRLDAAARAAGLPAEQPGR